MRDGRLKEENDEASTNEDELTRRDVEESDPRCDLCGAPMLDRHCKLVCVQCGYQRDCSDP